MSELNAIIIKAFRAWRRKTLKPKAKPRPEDAFAFYIGLIGAGETLPIGSWDVVSAALRQAGEIPAASACISVAEILARPDVRKRARRPARLVGP
jgi:hypothetical protein